MSRMYRTSSTQHNIALLFSKDADLDPTIIGKDSSELSKLFTANEFTGDDLENGVSNVEAIKEEIKESMYVVKLLEMIETVLEHEAHLFSTSERELLRQIQAVDSLQQFLIARLVQRKRGKWHRVDNLLSSYQRDLTKYLQVSEEDAPSKLAQALIGLCVNWRTRKGPTFVAPNPKDIIDLTLDSDTEDDEVKPVVKSEPQDTAPPDASGEDHLAFCFAEDTSSATPVQLLECLTLDELKLVAKRLKVPKTKQTRQELIKALLHSSSTQTTLPFTVVTKSSTKSSHKDKNDMRQFFVQAPTNKMPLQERRVRDMCYEIFGACFRVHDEVFRILHIVSIVYFRSTEYSESESIMLSAILATTRMRNYPSYTYRRTADIFKTRADMMRYTESLRLQAEIDDLLGGGPAGWATGAKYDRLEAARQVIERWKTIWDRWNSLVTYFKDKPPCDRGLERFEDGHILTRVVYYAAHCFGLLKDYGMELKLRFALVRQTRWRRGKRGGWYDRIALIYTQYMGGGDENLKKARDILLEALGDELVNIGSRPKLLKRLRRLEKKLRLPPEEQYVSDLELRAATLTTIEGVRVFTPPFPVHQIQETSATLVSGTKGTTPDGNADQQGSVTSATNSKPQLVQKGKTIWMGKEGEVDVETFALEYYATHGFKGFHSEGSIISTLFGLLFWDILFAPVPGAFETRYQSAPLDLFHDSFVSAREDLVKARIDELNNDEGAARRIIETVDKRERENETWCVGVRWDQFEREALLEIVECLGGRALATICRLLAEEYAYRGGGVPDLFIWNYAEKTCKFVEVKSPADQLSETQKVWIDVLLGAGVEVEVCRVYELGKTPTRRIKKDKPRAPSASKARSSKPQPKSGDLGDRKEPDPEPEEGDELWSSSEDGDGDGVPQYEDRGVESDQPILTESNQPLDNPTHNAGPNNKRSEDREDVRPHALSSFGDAGTLGKRDKQVTELGVHQEAGQAAKRARTSKPARTSTPARQKSPRLSPKLKTSKGPARMHTPTPKTTRQMPAAASASIEIKIKPEPTSPTTPSLTGSGPSLIGSERTDRGILTQETVVPETPPPPSQRERAIHSSPIARSNTTSEQSHNSPVAPTKRVRKEIQFEGEASTTATLKPGSKRRHTGSPVDVLAHHRGSIPDTPSEATPNNSGPCQPDDAEFSIARSRTPRKRASTSDSRGGVGASPQDWEKKWPDVFPKWVGDMVDKSSDGDYEPSQSQSESQ